MGYYGYYTNRFLDTLYYKHQYIKISTYINILISTYPKYQNGFYSIYLYINIISIIDDIQLGYHILYGIFYIPTMIFNLGRTAEVLSIPNPPPLPLGDRPSGRHCLGDSGTVHRWGPPINYGKYIPHKPLVNH